MGEHEISLTLTDPVPYSFNLDLTTAGPQPVPGGQPEKLDEALPGHGGGKH